MNREQIARERHNSDYNCANAVYYAFSDKVSGTAPIPRSEGGKCGAVLAAEKALGQLGLNSSAFDEELYRRYRSLMCIELRRAGYSCNDLVGTAAGLVSEMIDNKTVSAKRDKQE